MIAVRQIGGRDEAALQGLCELLTDAVHHGASMGFLSPLSQETARRYWDQVFAALGANLYLWVAKSEGAIVGSVQLATIEKENGRHRAEIQKLFVHSAHRGQGISSQLLEAAESFARSISRTLLVLDTQAGSIAESVYGHLGWQRVGEIPDFATNPNGELHATVYFYKRTTA